MNGPGLRVISGAAAVAASPLDAVAFQDACVDGFVASWSARGFSPVTIENASGVLGRFLELLGVPAWEAGPDDVDRVVGVLVARDMAASTRRGYVQAFKDFHRFLVARKAVEIAATFGEQGEPRKVVECTTKWDEDAIDAIVTCAEERSVRVR